MKFTLLTLLTLVLAASASLPPTKYGPIAAETSQCYLTRERKHNASKGISSHPRYVTQIGRPFKDGSGCADVYRKMDDAAQRLDLQMDKPRCVDDGNGNSLISATITAVGGADIGTKEDSKVTNAGELFHAAYPEIAFDCSKA